MGYTIPIIQIRDLLLVSIQIELTDGLVGELKAGVAREIRRRNAKGLIIEVSGVETFDSYIARSMRDIAQIARLMGVRTVVAGFDAATAITLVEMGMTMTGVATALSMDHALEMLAEANAERQQNEQRILEELGIDADVAPA